MGMALKGDPGNIIIRHNHYKLKRKLKVQVRKNKMSFQNTLVQKMNWCRKDSKLFWKRLDKLGKRPNEDVSRR